MHNAVFAMLSLTFYKNYWFSFCVWSWYLLQSIHKWPWALPIDFAPLSTSIWMRTQQQVESRVGDFPYFCRSSYSLMVFWWTMHVGNQHLYHKQTEDITTLCHEHLPSSNVFHRILEVRCGCHCLRPRTTS